MSKRFEEVLQSMPSAGVVTARDGTIISRDVAATHERVMRLVSEGELLIGFFYKDHELAIANTLPLDQAIPMLEDCLKTMRQAMMTHSN